MTGKTSYTKRNMHPLTTLELRAVAISRPTRFAGLAVMSGAFVRRIFDAALLSKPVVICESLPVRSMKGAKK